MRKELEEFLPESINLLKGNYKLQDCIADAKSGTLLSVLSFPLVMAYATASGLTPEIGLTTAIITGLISCLLGGGKFHVICPTGAFIVVINDIVTKYGYDFLIHATVLAGVLLFISAFLRFGRFSKYIPLSVLRGFLTGIGIMLVVQQAANIFGVTCSGNLFSRIAFYLTHLHQINVVSFGVGAFFIASFFVIRNNFPKVPVYLTILFFGIAYSYFFPNTLETISSRFHIDNCSIKLSPVVLSYGIHNILEILPYAVIIAFLAGIETLLGAVMVNDLCKTNHKTNAELISVGMTNFVSGIFCMMPSTCAISMTSVNAANAKSNVSLLFHVMALLLLMTVLSPLVSNVSMCCFASMVIPFGLGMIDYKSYRSFSGYNKATFVLTALVTVASNVVYAVIIGLAFHYFAELRQKKHAQKEHVEKHAI